MTRNGNKYLVMVKNLQLTPNPNELPNALSRPSAQCHKEELTRPLDTKFTPPDNEKIILHSSFAVCRHDKKQCNKPMQMNLPFAGETVNKTVSLLSICEV